LYKCQTPGYKYFECPKNVDTNRRRESKDDVSQGAENTYTFVIVDNIDDVQKEKGEN